MTARRSWLALLIATVLTLGAGAAPTSAQGRDVLVFAAASLKNALDDVAARPMTSSGSAPTTNSILESSHSWEAAALTLRARTGLNRHVAPDKVADWYMSYGALAPRTLIHPGATASK